MKKFCLLICFSLLLNFSIELTDQDYEYYYEILLGLAEGMTKTDEYRCVNHMVNNKPIVISVIKNITETIAAGGSAMDYAYENLQALEFLYEDCNLDSNIKILIGGNDSASIRELGYKIASNAHEIYLIIQNYSSGGNKLAEYGKILSSITNLYVY